MIILFHSSASILTHEMDVRRHENQWGGRFCGFHICSPAAGNGWCDLKDLDTEQCRMRDWSSHPLWGGRVTLQLSRGWESKCIQQLVAADERVVGSHESVMWPKLNQCLLSNSVRQKASWPNMREQNNLERRWILPGLRWLRRNQAWAWATNTSSLPEKAAGTRQPLLTGSPVTWWAMTGKLIWRTT